MTGDWRLDWPTISVSLFNTVLLTWLGLTVLLTTERRDWGAWMVGGGLLSGALFFVSHTALIGIGVAFPGTASEFWWHLGWTPLVLCPMAWYLVVLWHAGYWDAGAPAALKTQRAWIWLTGGLAAVLLVLILFSGLLPPLDQLALFQMGGRFSIAGFPLLPGIFSAYTFLTVGLSVRVLYLPERAERTWTTEARRQARPWLTGAGFALLGVSVLVGAFLVYWLSDFPSAAGKDYLAVAWFDLAISGLIALSVLLVGQAIVVYEVFSGRLLPRQGLKTGWRRAILLAAGYSVIVGGSFALGFNAVYSVLLTAGIMTGFYALLSWRQTAERERMMQQLRPFVASEGLYDRLLASESSPPDAGDTFRHLCRDLLGCSTAFLLPAGHLASLVRPLGYPENVEPPPEQLVPHFASGEDDVLILSSGVFHGASIGVPLRSARGFGGILLLGEKTGGGLFAQEEIEVARAFCERLLDVQAGTEIARRLMALQRQRIAQDQVIDRRIRRGLHDDILPKLHTAILALPAAEAKPRADLIEVHSALADLVRGMPPATGPEFRRLGWLETLRSAVEEEFSGAFDGTAWLVDPEARPAAAGVSALAGEVLFYAAREAVRNAARHARMAGSPLELRVEISLRGETGLQIVIADNGAGMDAGEAGASGGLRLHTTLMAIIGGTLDLESEKGRGTRVTLAVETADEVS